jgi:hypothetical protein
VAGIKRMIVHENFDYDTATNDICLLELQEIGRQKIEANFPP